MGRNGIFGAEAVAQAVHALRIATGVFKAAVVVADFAVEHGIAGHAVALDIRSG